MHVNSFMPYQPKCFPNYVQVKKISQNSPDESGRFLDGRVVKLEG